MSLVRHSIMYDPPHGSATYHAIITVTLNNASDYHANRLLIITLTLNLP